MASIYVSSSCVQSKKISESVQFLAEHGYRKIELSGGTNFYPDILKDLLAAKKKYNLKYRCHNYFPPPKHHFVLNLSASEKEQNIAIEHIIEAINLSALLGSDKMAIHAGFRMHPQVMELGKEIKKTDLIDKQEALARFINSFLPLQSIAKSKNIELYIENNVISKNNHKLFNGDNPFLATDYNSISELIELSGAKLLLDVAHLKVSCKTLQLDFHDELSRLLPLSDYLHCSDNNGYEDSNNGFSTESELYKELSSYNLIDKTITLEVYDGMHSLNNSYELFKKILEIKDAR